MLQLLDFLDHEPVYFAREVVGFNQVDEVARFLHDDVVHVPQAIRYLRILPQNLLAQSLSIRAVHESL